jgi:hypothetical protein
MKKATQGLHCSVQRLFNSRDNQRGVAMCRRGVELKGCTSCPAVVVGVCRTFVSASALMSPPSLTPTRMAPELSAGKRECDVKGQLRQVLEEDLEWLWEVGARVVVRRNAGCEVTCQQSVRGKACKKRLASYGT